jgi:MFS transporter, FSR family, fosmidomycin resistance protein
MERLHVADRKSSLFILLFALAHFVHHLLTAILIPLLPFIRDGFGLTYTQAGTIVSAFTLAYGFGQLPAGWIADRVGPRYLLAAGISGVAVTGAMLGLSGSFGGMIACLVLMGLLGGGYHPSASPLIAAAVPKEKRGSAIGIHIVGGSLSHFVAPLTAVFLAGLLGWRGVYLSTSLPVFLFGLWLLLLMIRKDIRVRSAGSGATSAGTSAASGPGSDGGSDDQSHTHRPLTDVVLFLVMSASVGAAVGASISFVPLYMVDSIGLSQEFAGVLYSLYYLAGMGAAPLGGMLADRLGPVRVFLVAVALAGPALMVMGLFPSWGFMAFIMLALGAVAFTRMTCSEIFFVTSVPDRNRSTVLGVYFFAGMEGNGILTPFLGAAIDAWGFSSTFLGTGAVLTIVLVVSAILFLIVRRNSNIPVPVA